MPTPYTLVTDRGGHLHNALMLVAQLGYEPSDIVTTFGPDIGELSQRGSHIHSLPYLFTWIGKLRLFNPFSCVYHMGVSFYLALKIRPQKVVSLGASNVVFFCYFAKLFGAKVYHVECMNQVRNKSITGLLLYPICDLLFVQWKELLSQYGPKARYEGWVL